MSKKIDLLPFIFTLCFCLFQVTVESEAGTGINGDIFAKQGGYFHPFATINTSYTDNYNYSKTDKEEEFYSLATSGLLLTLPGKKIDTPGMRILRVVSPGGRAFQGIEKKPVRNFQTALLYNAEVKNHSNNSAIDTFYSNAEGMFQYNFRGGLSFKLVGYYQEAQDSRKNNTINGLSEYEISEYSAHVEEVYLFYTFSDRLGFGLDYSAFTLEYDTVENRYKDRQDNFISGSLFFHVFWKTTLFIEYAYYDIQYDERTILDSELNTYAIGFKWKYSDKFTCHLKGGYGQKNLKDPAIDDKNDVIFQGTFNYYATSKATITIDMFRESSETDIQGAEYLVFNHLGISYKHKLSDRMNASLKLQTTKDAYKGGQNDGDSAYSHVVNLGVNYTFNGWLQMFSDYTFQMRESHSGDNVDFNENDFKNNTLSLKLKVCL